MAETLNLINPNDPLSCKYEISKFPDGQQSIKIVEHNYCTFYSLSEQKHPITIYSRMNSFKDVELIICATQALRDIGVKRIKLYVPYFIGGRSDRKFSSGGVNYIKQVIAPIINSQGYEAVGVMDPHSDVIEACINNFRKISTEKLITSFIKDYFIQVKGLEKSDYSKFVLMSPDAGAMKKIYDLASSIRYEGDIITCSKHRDVDGKLTKTIVPLNIPLNDVMDKDIIIVDDICDGGGTFINIAKVIKEEKRFVGKIYLIVTHGIFSRGFDELSKYFDRIYTTNSINDITESPNNFIKQINIF